VVAGKPIRAGELIAIDQSFSWIHSSDLDLVNYYLIKYPFYFKEKMIKAYHFSKIFQKKS